MTVNEVLESVAVLLGDANKIFFVDDVLLPFVKAAHLEIQNDLIANGFRPFEVLSVVITIPANSKVIPVPPDNLFVIQKIEEAAVGSTDFVQMHERAWEPNTVPSTVLGSWVFRESKVQLIGATVDRDIKLYYIANNVGTISGAGSTINLTNALPVYAARVAYLAAQFKGRNKEAARALLGLYGQRLVSYITIEIKSQQGVTYRRRPYSTKRQAIT